MDCGLTVACCGGAPDNCAYRRSEEESNTFIDGGGVYRDTPLPRNAHIRFNLPGTNKSITVYVDGGKLRLVGQYLPLFTDQIAINAVEVEAREL